MGHLSDVLIIIVEATRGAGSVKLKFVAPMAKLAIDSASLACHCINQGSYRSWKTLKVMEFDNLDSRLGKSWNFGPGPGKS